MKPSIKERRRKWLQSRPAGLPSFVYLNRQGGSGAGGPEEAYPQVMGDNAAFSGIALLTTALFHLIWHSRYLINASESLLENENLNRRQWRQEHSVVMAVFIYENSRHRKELLKTILSSFGNCLSFLWLVYDLWRIVGHGIIKTFDMKRLTIQRNNKWARKWSHVISRSKKLSYFLKFPWNNQTSSLHSYSCESMQCCSTDLGDNTPHFYCRRGMHLILHKCQIEMIKLNKDLFQCFSEFCIRMFATYFSYFLRNNLFLFLCHTECTDHQFLSRKSKFLNQILSPHFAHN